MKTTLMFVLLILVVSMVAVAEAPKKVYRVLNFGWNTVGIFCTNGADPTVMNPNGRVLEVSCGGETAKVVR